MKNLIKSIRKSRRRAMTAVVPSSQAVPESALPSRLVDATAHEPDHNGYIDVIGTGLIAGWAASRADPEASVTVRLYLDDWLCAEGIAAIHRPDVVAAGYGKSNHGFEIPVPKKALICAERLRLVVVNDDGSEFLCSEKRLRQKPAEHAPVLYFDASDLVEYLSYHRELSGIQRVQAGYLLSLGDTTIAGTECRICTRFKSSSFYFHVPPERFALLLRQAGDTVLVTKGAWTAHVQAFKQSFDTRVEFGFGDTIFTLGAPWALEDHNETIRCIKQHDGARYLQIFYDLIPISVPEVVAAELVPHFARAMAAMSLYADHVFAISRYAQDDLAATLRRLERPVPATSVIPMGGTITETEESADATADALDRLGVGRPFILCVGTLEPRKNHMLLFRVWRRLVEKHGAENVPLLVLVGRVGWYMDDFLRQLRVTDFVSKTIRHLQGVSNTELAQLYDGSLFTIFPSFNEGWGLPITESLARGKVCVCSNVTSMPEAGGTHALYIDPYDTTAALELCERLIYEDGFLAEQEARLHDFKALSWTEASQGLRAQLVELMPKLSVLPKPAPRQPIALGRTYKFYDIENISPGATATETFRNYLDKEEALDLLVGWNWFEVDIGCTWACGDRATLQLLVQDEAGALVAHLGLSVPPHGDGRILHVGVDGVAQGSCRVREGLLMLSVPIPGMAEEHRVDLELSGPRKPHSDGRLLGIGVSTVVVHRRDHLADKATIVHAGAIVVLD